MARARKKKIEPPKLPVWSARDRNTQTTGTVLREMRVSTLVGAPVDPDKHIELIETLEALLDATNASKLFKLESTLTVEALPEAIARLEEERVDGSEDQVKEIARLTEYADDLEASHAKARKEHAAELDALHEKLDAMRALLTRALPLLETLGDHIGNGPIDPNRRDSFGTRCDLILDIKEKLS